MGTPGIRAEVAKHAAASLRFEGHEVLSVPKVRVSHVMIGAMANPAEALHEILTEWSQPPGSATAILGFRGMNGRNPEVLQKHRLAMRLIEQIRELAPYLCKSDAMRAALERNVVRWTAWVLAYPLDWQSGLGTGNDSLSHQDSLDYLQSLSMRIDGLGLAVDDNELQTLAQTVDSAKQLLIAATDLPLSMREHIHLVLNHVDYVLGNHAITSDFDLRLAAGRLGQTLQEAANASEDGDRKKAWLALAGRAVLNWAGQTAGQVLNAWVMAQIGPGMTGAEVVPSE